MEKNIYLFLYTWMCFKCMYTEKRHYMFINIYKKNPIDVDKCVQIEHTFWIDKHVHVQTNMYTTDICDIEW